MLRTKSPDHFFLSILLLCLGCAGPTLTSRVVGQDSFWFLRLDSFHDAGSSPLRYGHPTSWRDEELSAILSRLFIEERVGLMDSAPPARSLFTVEEINAFVPAIRKAFQEAESNEWIVFTLIQPREYECAVTSGGMFIERERLHVIVANHRTLLALGSEQLARVKANPLYSVTGSGGVLAFDSPRFIMGRKANWSGGHRASASELILDHVAFLSYLKLEAGNSTPLRPVTSSDPALAMEPGTSKEPSSNGGGMDSEAVINQLRKEIVRLKKLMAEKDAEIDRLKHRPAPSP